MTIFNIRPKHTSRMNLRGLVIYVDNVKNEEDGLYIYQRTSTGIMSVIRNISKYHPLTLMTEDPLINTQIIRLYKQYGLTAIISNKGCLWIRHKNYALFWQTSDRDSILETLTDRNKNLLEQMAAELERNNR